MKKRKIYERSLDQQTIRWLKNVVVNGYWEQNKDGTITVEGDVDISHQLNENLPIQFKYVSGLFDCSFSSLDSLSGCPREVGGNFICHNSAITSLEGGPEIVGKSFEVHSTWIKTLKGLPKIVTKDFYCYGTNITDAWELRYIFLCELGGEFFGGDNPFSFHPLNDLINDYKYTGENKAQAAKGMMALKNYIEEFGRYI